MKSFEEVKKNLYVFKEFKCSCAKVLLVDDSEIIRMILSEIMQENGYSYQHASNGQVAFDIVRQRMRNKCCKQFQVIIMDCEMPVMNGWKATYKIRQLGYQAAIIGYTAYANQQDVKRCLEAGMNSVLFKPSKSEIILEEIRKFEQ